MARRHTVLAFLAALAMLATAFVRAQSPEPNAQVPDVAATSGIAAAR